MNLPPRSLSMPIPLPSLLSTLFPLPLPPHPPRPLSRENFCKIHVSVTNIFFSGLDCCNSLLTGIAIAYLQNIRLTRGSRRDSLDHIHILSTTIISISLSLHLVLLAPVMTILASYKAKTG